MRSPERGLNSMAVGSIRPCTGSLGPLTESMRSRTEAKSPASQALGSPTQELCVSSQDKGLPTQALSEESQEQRSPTQALSEASQTLYRHLRGFLGFRRDKVSHNRKKCPKAGHGMRSIASRGTWRWAARQRPGVRWSSTALERAALGHAPQGGRGLPHSRTLREIGRVATA